MEGLKNLSQEGREVFIIGFTGDNRQGKSVECAKIALQWKKANPTGSIIAYDPQKRFPFADINITIEDTDWAEIVAERTHVLLILDDYKELIPGNNETKGILKLMAKRAENGIDIIYICHSPTDVLERFTKHTHEFYVFYTNSKHDRIKDKIPNNPQLFIDAVEYMNKYILDFGLPNYPGPFPYVVVNIKKNTITAVHFKHQY